MGSVHGTKIFFSVAARQPRNPLFRRRHRLRPSNFHEGALTPLAGVSSRAARRGPGGGPLRQGDPECDHPDIVEFIDIKMTG